MASMYGTPKAKRARINRAPSFTLRLLPLPLTQPIFHLSNQG